MLNERVAGERRYTVMDGGGLERETPLQARKARENDEKLAEMKTQVEALEEKHEDVFKQAAAANEESKAKEGTEAGKEIGDEGKASGNEGTGVGGATAEENDAISEGGEDHLLVAMDATGEAAARYAEQRRSSRASPIRSIVSKLSVDDGAARRSTDVDSATAGEADAISEGAGVDTEDKGEDHPAAEARVITSHTAAEVQALVRDLDAANATIRGSETELFAARAQVRTLQERREEARATAEGAAEVQGSAVATATATATSNASAKETTTANTTAVTSTATVTSAANAHATAMNEALTSLFTTLDIDKDGFVDKGELLGALRDPDESTIALLRSVPALAGLLKPQHYAEAFEAMDTNQNGSVDLGEMFSFCGEGGHLPTGEKSTGATGTETTKGGGAAKSTAAKLLTQKTEQLALVEGKLAAALEDAKAKETHLKDRVKRLSVKAIALRVRITGQERRLLANQEVIEGAQRDAVEAGDLRAQKDRAEAAVKTSEKIILELQIMLKDCVSDVKRVGTRAKELEDRNDDLVRRVYERHGGKQMVAELQRRTMAAEKSAMAAQASAEKAERRTATMRKWQVAQHAARIDALEKDLAATTLRRDEMTSRVVLLEKNAHKSQKRVKRQRHDMEAMQVRHM